MSVGAVVIVGLVVVLVVVLLRGAGWTAKESNRVWVREAEDWAPATILGEDGALLRVLVDGATAPVSVRREDVRPVW